MWQRIQGSLIDLLNSIIYYPKTKTGKLLNSILLILFLLFGLVLWIKFLNFGNIPSDRLDWLDITFPRLSVLQQALLEWKIPFHITQSTGIKGVTDRFLSIPDLILTPDLIFLRIYSIETTIMIHVLLLYIIGFWGLYLFRQKYHLSIIVFVLLFLLFNFNGHIVSHLAVGHLTWASYFFLPFFVLLIFEFFEKQVINWKWVAKVSLVQFLIFLAGGYHVFVWCLFFLGILLLVNRQNKKWIFLSILFSILINLFRILPSALLAGLLSIDFMAGFPSTDRLFFSLISMVNPAEAYTFPDKVNILVWEYDFYIGLVGLILISIFCGLFFIKNKKSEYRNFVIPITILTILSIGNLYKPIFDTGIPLISGERISSRFFILPLLIIIFSSALAIHDLIMENKNKYKFSFFFIIAIILIANDLTQHLANWGLGSIIRNLPAEISPDYITLGISTDPLYISLVFIGIALTIASSAFLIKKSFHR